MKKLLGAIAILIALQVAISSCQRSDDEPSERPPYKVEDWKEGGTFETDLDDGRPMTHEDSIRFGLI